MKMGSVAALGLVVALAVVTSPAHAAKGVKKNGEHAHHGTVVGIEKTGSAAVLEIKTHHHKKKTAQAGTARTAKFELTAGTKIEFIQQKQTQPASLSDLRIGEHVTVRAKNKVAELVAIHKHAKNKKPGKKSIQRPVPKLARKNKK